MTEEGWLAADRLETLIAFAAHSPLCGKRGPRARRLRLVGCGAVRTGWADLPDDLLRRAVVVAEEFADGGCGPRTLEAAQWAVVNLAHWLKSPWVGVCDRLCEQAPADAARCHRPWDDWPAGCGIVRDIFNPFRPVAFDLDWRTTTAVAVARAMYEARDFAPMSVLADALEDAGCDHPDVIAHCRDPHGVHVRGCWVVDGVLGLP